MSSQPTNEDLEELLLSCRYGELEEVEEFVKIFGEGHLATVRDVNGNTVLHMTCGNGYTILLSYLLKLIPPALIAVTNDSKSTPLHWATVNKHLEILKLLVEAPNGPGAELLEQKDLAGVTVIGEAEREEWEEGAQYLISMMSIKSQVAVKETTGDVVEDTAALHPTSKSMSL